MKSTEEIFEDTIKRIVTNFGCENVEAMFTKLEGYMKMKGQYDGIKYNGRTFLRILVNRNIQAFDIIFV